MSHGKTQKQPTALEVRRLTFRSAVPLLPILTGLDAQDLGGGEIKVDDSVYSKVLARLKNTGFRITTVHDRRHELPYIYRERCNTPFRRERIEDDAEKWYYLSPNARRWRRVPYDENAIIVRDGWALCHFPTGARREFFYLEKQESISNCIAKGNIAILKGYAGVTGTLSVPIWEDQRFIYAIWPGYVIPKEHENFLAEALSPLDQPLKVNEIEALWMWRQADRDLVEEVLRALRLELRPWSITNDWVRTLSAIFSRAYGQYLKDWEGLGRFPEIVRCRAWEEIGDESLRQILEKVSTEESKGNVTAHIILEYLAEKLPVAISWRENGGAKIRVFTLESSEVTWQGQDQEKKYYRFVVPQLECVIGWKSRALPWWGGYTRPMADISHWRILPHPGRMRTAPDAEVTPSKGTESDKKNVLRTLLGIPRVEWDLAQSHCIDAFLLDLEASHWKGALDFARYWYGGAKVVRRDPSESDQPSLLLRDITGFEFVLGAPQMRPSQRPKVGYWIEFVASTSLIEQTSNPPLPTFSLIRPEIARVVDENSVIKLCVFSLIRYHFGISATALNAYFSKFVSIEQLQNFTLNLIEADDIILFKSRYYYRYNGVTSEEMKEYVETHEPLCLPLSIHKLRSIIHPLSPLVSNLVDSNGQLFRIPYSAPQIKVTNEDISECSQETDFYLRKVGYVIVSGRGVRRSVKALEVVKQAVERFDPGTVNVTRSVSTFIDPMGREHPQLDFKLIYPAQLLKNRYR